MNLYENYLKCNSLIYTYVFHSVYSKWLVILFEIQYKNQTHPIYLTQNIWVIHQSITEITSDQSCLALALQFFQR